MKIAELKKKGGFVPSALVKKEVTWKKGDDELTFTVHVKRQSFGTVEKLFSGDDDQSRSAAFIAASLRLGENGVEEMTYEDAYQLDPSLAAVFIEAINEVNGTGRKEPKN